MYLLSASSSCPDSIWFWRRRKLYVLLNSQEESVSLHFSFLGQSFLVYFNFFIFFWVYVFKLNYFSFVIVWAWGHVQLSFWRTLRDTLPDLYGSLAPDALLSRKHIENTEKLPYSSPQGVFAGWVGRMKGGCPAKHCPVLCQKPHTYASQDWTKAL